MTVASGTATVDQFKAFCQLVHRHTGLDLASYKRTQMERRVLAMVERAGAADLATYWRQLLRDPQALRDFMDRVTINVSEFLRNPEKFTELREMVLPELRRMGRGLSVWSAGCSYGAEPYSLRMVLDDMGWRTGVSILATDIDQGVLARAQAGCFAAEDLRNVPAAWRERYFTPEGEGFQVRPTLKQGVTFRRHDLLRDTYPQQVDLILCRNVVIYFTEEAKARLFETMCQALRPGGFLFIGSTERIADAARLGLVSREAFIYQRPCTNG